MSLSLSSAPPEVTVNPSLISVLPVTVSLLFKVVFSITSRPSFKIAPPYATINPSLISVVPVTVSVLFKIAFSITSNPFFKVAVLSTANVPLISVAPITVSVLFRVAFSLTSRPLSSKTQYCVDSSSSGSSKNVPFTVKLPIISAPFSTLRFSPILVFPPTSRPLPKLVFPLTSRSEKLTSPSIVNPPVMLVAPEIVRSPSIIVLPITLSFVFCNTVVSTSLPITVFPFTFKSPVELVSPIVNMSVINCVFFTCAVNFSSSELNVILLLSSSNNKALLSLIVNSCVL